MAIIDAIKWDAPSDVFAWKYPENNLTTYTQLIVNESQEALFFHKGKLITTFGPGKHTLSTENIPILENLFGIPFGGKNPFTAEIWFVNKVFSLDIKWGTAQPFQIRDPQYAVIIPVRSHGQFGIQITDSAKFILKLVGTLPLFNKNNLVDYFRGFILSKATSVIAREVKKENSCVLDIASQVSSISDSLCLELKENFQHYGIELINFYINQISVNEDDASVIHLKQMLSKRLEMDVLGYTYNQQRSFDVLENASKNEGMSGNVMGAGMGVGLGFGIGNTYNSMMKSPMFDTADHPTKACTNCHAQISQDSRFCGVCGTSIASSKENSHYCDKCNRPIPPDAKFCPFCGDKYNPCPKCGADIAENASQCPKCGELMPKKCLVCQTLVSGNAQFCSTCGSKL